MLRITVSVLLLALVLATSGCGGGSSFVSEPGQGATSVVVSPSVANVLRGDTQQFTAKVLNESNKTVTWSILPNLGTISATGLYTAPTNFDGGSVIVTATSAAFPIASGTAVVTLPAVSFSVAPEALAISPGANQSFAATVVGLNSNLVDWTVQGTGGGTITSGGLYTAPPTAGVDYVTAKASSNANYSAMATVLITTTGASFSPTGSVHDGREFHTATLLADGTVLVAGGGHPDAYCLNGIDSAELYDSIAGTFAATGTMTIGRYAQSSTLLQNGKVLIAGGFSSVSDCPNAGITPALTSAELYDPSSGSFAPTGNMTEDRGGHTATLLANGKVLIAGGTTVGGDALPSFFSGGSATAEVYDPATGTFTSTGSMVTPRVGQTATLLANGKVLLAGGLTSNSAIATAELYDPATGTFTSTGSMTVARGGHTATRLQNGRVLISGGFNGVRFQNLSGFDSAEIYDPASGSFTTTGSMAVGRVSHTATLLPDGTVLVVGGGSQLAETYTPSSSSFSLFGLTGSPRSGHSATLLTNGKVVIVGGTGAYYFTYSGLTTAEVSQ